MQAELIVHQNHISHVHTTITLKNTYNVQMSFEIAEHPHRVALQWIPRWSHKGCSNFVPEL